MTRNRGSDWYRRPELILAELLQREARLEDRADRHYRRAVVMAVDMNGGMLQNPNGSGGLAVVDRGGKSVTYPALPGVENPRGAVKARVLTDGLDRLVDDRDLRVYWPMFPQDQMGIPISPGEHVYVVFEDEGLSHGLWIARVSGQDSANSFKGEDSYTAPSAPRSAMDFFEPNDPEYRRTDDRASLAPPKDSTRFFGGGEDD